MQQSSETAISSKETSPVMPVMTLQGHKAIMEWYRVCVFQFS